MSVFEAMNIVRGCTKAQNKINKVNHEAGVKKVLNSHFKWVNKGFKMKLKYLFQCLKYMCAPAPQKNR